MRFLDVAEVVAPYVGEFLGTFFVVFTVGCNRVSGSETWMPTSIGFAITVGMYATRSVSGGHLNPTLSLAMAMCRKMRMSRALLYILTQLAAGVAAAYLCHALLHSSPRVEERHGYDLLDALIVEVVFSSMFAFVALNVMASSRTNPKLDRNQFFAMAVGFVAIAGGTGGLVVSGAFFNPAVTLGFGFSGQAEWFRVLFYLGAQFASSIIAAALFFLVRPEELAALGITGEGFSCRRACGALSICSLCGGRGGGAGGGGGDPLPDVPEEASPDAQGLEEAAKQAYSDSYSAHFPARFLSEFLGTYAVVFTYGCNLVVMSATQLEGSTVPVTNFTAHGPVGPGAAGAFYDARGRSSQMTFEQEESKSSTVAWATGSAVLSMVYALGNVSGGHLNPAITLSVLLANRPGAFIGEAPFFMLAQVAGGICAALTFVCVRRGEITNPKRVLDLGPKNGYTWTSVAIAEAAFTMAVALVLLCVTTVKSPRYPQASSTKSFQFALAIGVSVTAGSYALEGITGGILNPAASLGIFTSNFICSGFELGGGTLWTLVWYVGFQMLGGVIASFIFILTHPMEYKEDPLLRGQERAAAEAAKARLRSAATGAEVGA